MKATRAERVAHVIAAEFTQWTVDREAVEKRIAEAIEKAVEAERRACAREASNEADECDDAGGYISATSARSVAKRIRARGRS